MDIFSAFAMFVDAPLLALFPATGFALAGLAVRSRAAWIAAAGWALYAAYEGANFLRLTCSGDCNIRADMLLIVPVLLVVSLVGVLAIVRRLPKPRPS